MELLIYQKRAGRSSKIPEPRRAAGTWWCRYQKFFCVYQKSSHPCFGGESYQNTVRHHEQSNCVHPRIGRHICEKNESGTLTTIKGHLCVIGLLSDAFLKSVYAGQRPESLVKIYVQTSYGTMTAHMLLRPMFSRMNTYCFFGADVSVSMGRTSIHFILVGFFLQNPVCGIKATGALRIYFDFWIHQNTFMGL